MTEKSEATRILFYCKDCQQVVLNPKKHPKKYEYSCTLCKGQKVSFGTKEAICDFFHIKDSMLEKMLANQSGQ